MSQPDAAVRARHRRGWLLAFGVCLLVAVVVSHDARGVAAALATARFAALAVVGAHLPVTFTAGLGWRALLAPPERPAVRRTFRLRLVKEAVNALLPVAQVGGDVVRARLAAGPKLPLRVSAASCVVDALLGVACLALFVLLGLAVAAEVVPDARTDRLSLQLAAWGAVLVVGLLTAERLGLLRVADRMTARAEGALRDLSGIGQAVDALLHRPLRVTASMGWHLASWTLGVAETWTAMWALGLPADWAQAFVVESLAQGARALGFAIPGAVGVQEGGYVLIGGSLGLTPEDALALALLRRLRELALGGVGLLLWRFEPARGPEG